MYQPFVLVVAGLLAAAPTLPAAPNRAETPATSKKPVVRPVRKAPAVVAKTKAASVNALSSRKMAFFKRVNVAPLLRFNAAEGNNIFNGFYSYDYWRLEFVLTSVKRDSEHPNVYYVRGKSRHHRKVTPFSGTITFTDYLALAKPNTSDLPHQPWQAATISGTFAFQEAGGRRGTFSGEVDMDIAPDKERGVQTWCCAADNETRGGGILFEGQWRSGKEQVPVIWKDNIFGLARQILTDFEIGERDVHINRKYAARGWDTYWENEEWWAEKPLARR
ncbi:hypothetical protein F0P96_16145 [Hymenobacter busanensis]|uniref:Uncharacterized protein n=1 Tax=Hymenobacter busanensis TaxID=2607656 RepID=A0A7L4ZXI6_9BACT|nr:hypothetical protein [Hymenobacter busanensis]KAA9327512.1 hypothetical protein F0P96_16145 [Hymenobacter busanensis]QHJ06150.1 hypothetical protein GUY19_02090 [Hymenobacter busanensis]